MKPGTLGPGGYLVAAGMIAAVVAVIALGAGGDNPAASQLLGAIAALLTLCGVILIAGDRARTPPS